MTSRTGRVAILAFLAVVAVALFVVLRDDEAGDSSTELPGGGAPAGSTVAEEPATPAAEVIEVRDGAVVGGARELTYSKGEQVLIDVKLDEPQEDVHIHGYDIERLNPSGTVRFDFKAGIEGIFELEAHGPSGDVVLAEIRVEPA